MSDSEIDRPSVRLGRDEILMAHYREMRQGIRNRAQQSQARITRGAGAIAIVAGYAFYAEGGLILLSIVPFLIGILFISHVHSMNWLNRIVSHVVTIQHEIDVRGFDWETEYGVYSTGGWSRLGTSIPNFAFYLSVVVFYVVSVGVSLRVLRTEGPEVFGYTPNPATARLIYLLLTLLLVAVAFSYWHTLKKNAPNELTH